MNCTLCHDEFELNELKLLEEFYVCEPCFTEGLHDEEDTIVQCDSCNIYLLGDCAIHGNDDEGYLVHTCIKCERDSEAYKTDKEYRQFVDAHFPL